MGVTEPMWVCELCGNTYPLDELRYTCDCPRAGRLDLRYTAPVADERRGGGIWRYGAILPIAADDPVALTVGARFPAGGTPLHRADALADALGVNALWIKNEAANPTGSLKDRASAVVVAAALKLKLPVVSTASSGNAGAALAGAAAACGLPCVVFLPSSASSARCAQLLRYGAEVLVVDGDYDAAVELSVAACREWGWFCRTSAVNPYTTQGKKTVALEIAEQLEQPPDAVVVPAGDGNILVGLHRGFRDAHRLGWIDRVPRLVAVQAAGAPAIHRAWAAGAADVEPIRASTVADGISVGAPLDGTRALEAIRDTGGTIVTVTDDAITEAEHRMARDAGVVSELTSAAGVAALPGLVSDGVLGRTDTVVLVNTGRGPGRPAGSGAGARRVAPELAAVRDVVGELATRLSGVSGT